MGLGELMVSFRFEKQQPSSLRHRVADMIRRAIITGQLKSGDWLREQEIADQMSVSRGPIREAFSLLEREGLVVTYPYKGTVVATLSTEEITEILLPIRLTLESFAIKNALADLRSEYVDYLESLVRKMNLSAEEGDLSKLVEQDVEFHEFLIRNSAQPTVVSLWQSIDMRIRLHFTHHGKKYGDLYDIPREHRQLLDAIRTRDYDTAIQAIHHHILDLNMQL